MKVIKNIHNNISLCIDSQGNEIVAFGKGIGFKKPPYDLPLSAIERTFYNVDSAYVEMLATIPEAIIDVSSEIIEYANSISKGSFSPNLVITLADHINFAIKRYQEKIHIRLPMLYEVKIMYPNEIKIGYFALERIKDRLHIDLPRDEAAVITLHIIDYGLIDDSKAMNQDNDLIEKCTQTVENYMNIKIDRDGFNYSRFVSHMYFLLERVKQNTEVSTENHRLYEKLMKEFPNVNNCALKICEILRISLNEEEIMYLILHINRLCSREEK